MPAWGYICIPVVLVQILHGKISWEKISVGDRVLHNILTFLFWNIFTFYLWLCIMQVFLFKKSDVFFALKQSFRRPLPSSGPCAGLNEPKTQAVTHEEMGCCCYQWRMVLRVMHPGSFTPCRGAGLSPMEQSDTCTSGCMWKWHLPEIYRKLSVGRFSWGQQKMSP